MKKSIIRRLRILMYGFGIFMGAVFPFYASMFDNAGGSQNIFFKLGCYVAGLLIGVFCFALVKFSIIKELKKINTLSEALKNRDLTVSISLDSHDELGDIVNNLSDSMNSIRTMVHSILAVSEQLEYSLGQLKNFMGNLDRVTCSIRDDSEHMTNSVEMINKTSFDIAERATETVTSVKEMSSEILQLSDSLHVVNEKCSEEMAVTRHVSDKFEHTKSAIVELSSHSIEIGKITDAIKTIADKTNLLAINAAVEAAIAGQYGKSFAVVANEVKELADQSLKSANDISQLIEIIQPIIENSKESIMESTDDMNNLRTLAEDIANKAINEVQLINTIERELSGSSSNILSVADSIHHTSLNMRENSDKIQGVNSSIKTMYDEIAKERVHIETLEQRAVELHNLTHSFTV